jgi:hypothetical protein
MPRVMKEYKILIVTEGGLGTLFLGASKLPTQRIEEELNRHGREGWEMEFMLVEQHRYMLFWTREAAVITLSRPLA